MLLMANQVRKFYKKAQSPFQQLEGLPAGGISSGKQGVLKHAQFSSRQPREHPDRLRLFGDCYLIAAGMVKKKKRGKSIGCGRGCEG